MLANGEQHPVGIVFVGFLIEILHKMLKVKIFVLFNQMMGYERVRSEEMFL